MSEERKREFEYDRNRLEQGRNNDEERMPRYNRGGYRPPYG